MSGIDQLWPQPTADLNDEEILQNYAFPGDRPWLRMNFVSSLDGAGTRGGRSGQLGDDADRRVFDLLRREADAILVAAGTLRIEGYGGMRLDNDSVTWRRAHKLPEHPTVVIVSNSLNLDLESPVFTDAPVRPIVCTSAVSPADRRKALEAVADVIVTGDTTVDPHGARAALAELGLSRVHSEGGPSLFGAFLVADAVDELCLTLAPSLEAGGATRIAVAPEEVPREMSLSTVLRSDDELLLRYLRRHE